MSEGLVLAGRYRLVQQLGAGGMGSVWLAQDLNLGVDVAIKLIDPAIAESVEAVNRFRQEAQSAAMIRSTHVVQILDHGIDDGRPFIAMELLKGENLGQRLERAGQLEPAHVAAVLGQVGRALSLAHAAGIVHRDLKPDNIFLVREGDEEIAKVLDFGVARKVTGLTDASTSKTRTGAMLGTPYYMSPEQATGQSVDHASDIWAFGVIAFECLTGRRAFDGETVGALFHAICMVELPVPSTIAAVPEGFDAWFARAVCRDKSQRFPTIKAAAEELRALCGRHSGFGTAPGLSGYRSGLASQQTLTTTAVSAVSTGLERTAPPSSRTLMDQVRKRPVLWSVLTVSTFAAASLAVFAVGTGASRDVLSTAASARATAAAFGTAPESDSTRPVAAGKPAPSAHAESEPRAVAGPIPTAPASGATASTGPASSALVEPGAIASESGAIASESGAATGTASSARSSVPSSASTSTKSLPAKGASTVLPKKRTSATELPKSKEKKSFFKRDDNAAGI
ncbi:MAG: serine/threonine-protein kinase [Polyangiaceae bacterium]